MTASKPSVSQAMQQLIDRVETEIPFDLPIEVLCAGTCHGCAKKLLEYLRTEVDEWQSQLDAGQVPSFGELEKRARTARKIHQQLVKNQLITA